MCAGNWRRQRGAERGAALVFALAIVLIVSLLIFGLTQFATQHHSLAHTERDAVAALHAAEAAINWELNKMARLEEDPSLKIDTRDDPGPPGGVLANDSGSGPAVAGAQPIQGAVSVYVTHPNKTDNWLPPSSFRIFATGTVNGVRRTVESFGVAVGLSDRYALYGIHSLTLVNAAIASGSNFKPNFIGSAGICTVSNSTLNGTVVFDRLDGTPGRWGGTAPAWDRVVTPLNNPFPTVDQIGSRVIRKLEDRIVSDPIAYFKNGSNNDNDERIMFRGKKGQLSPVQWPVDDPEHVKINDKLFEVNDADSLVLLGNDALKSGFPRGSNFYLEELVIPPGKTLEILNGRETAGSTDYGPVRLWLGPRGLGSGTDRFRLTDGSLVVYNNPLGEPDPDAFVLYNGSAAPIQIGGLDARSSKRDSGAVLTGFFGFIYSYNVDDSGARFGAVDIVGDLILRGSIIGWDVTQSGGYLDAYLSPAASGSVDGAKYVLFYTITPLWQEKNPVYTTGGSY